MKGYKTLTFNGGVAFLLIVAEIFAEFGSSPEVQYFLTPEMTPYIMLGILFANIVLRVVTTSPVFRSYDE